MDLRSWLSALGGAPAGGAAYGMAAPPVQNAQPMGLAVPPMARGTKLSAEMDYDGTHPRQQEQAARDHFRSYGPNMLMDALIPGYGAGGDAKAASEAYGEGRYGAAALNAGMAAADFLPFLSVLPAAAKGIRAYHGSPHDFDRFDMSKIGTGEGAQAYGHGLYFADSEDVAKSYRMMGADVSIRPEPDGTLSVLAGPRGGSKSVVGNYKTGDEAFAAMQEQQQAFGRMYEVNINADPEAFLDWDKPLSEQPAKVREALSKFNLTTDVKDGMSLMPGARLRIETDPGLPEYPRYFMEMDSGQRFRLQPQDLKNMIAQSPNEIRGNTVVSTIANQIGGETAATAALRDAGIPGIKYLDAGSRGAGDGSRNYVVFDDRLITILRKYGIGGLIAGGGAYALTDAEYAQAAELLAQDGMNTGAR